MYFFKFHIGDFRSATAHLSNEEELAYRRLLDMYYDTEKPIPLETQWVSRRLRVGLQSVEIVLSEFFKKTDDGYINERCDDEIAKYHKKAEANRNNGLHGGRKPSGLRVGTESQPNRNPTVTLTTNQEPRNININNPPIVPPRGKSACTFDDRFDAFWVAYGKKVAKGAAEKAWRRAATSEQVVNLIMQAVPRYVASTPDLQYRKHPATWLNQRCWEDETPGSSGALGVLGVPAGDEANLTMREKQLRLCDYMGLPRSIIE